MPHESSTLPLLRLLQVADSSFPAGGFAYSHGLEWLAHEGLVRTEDDIAAFLRAYVLGAGGGQALAAALQCLRARSLPRVAAIDRRLDASIVSSPEREASTAMGARLLEEASEALECPYARAFLGLVAAREAPGHYPVAFAVVISRHGIDERSALAALAFTMVNSITQAAVRLGLIGQRSMLRLNAGAATAIELVVARLIAGRPLPLFGAFLPAAEIATARHAGLSFRMFAT